MSDSNKSSKPGGFLEAPQPPFEGAPVSRDVSSWAEKIVEEAESNPQGGREKVANKAEKKAPSGKAKGKGGDKVGHSFTSSAGRSLPSDKKQQVGNKRTGSGVSIGGTNDVRERVAAGLNPVAGLDVSAEDALKMESTSGVTATVQALSELIEHGRDELKGDIWVPHRPDRPDKDPDQKPFRVVSEFEPKGDQPTAIKELVEGLRGVDWNAGVGTSQDAEEASGPYLPTPAERRVQPVSVSANPNRGERTQVLLGVTGSGKTFTMAKVIEETQRPALILAPNKTLAAQLYGEFKHFFPDNAVEYFVSYYDYYQPEAYVPRTDTFLRLSGHYRLSRKHRLDFHYADVSREGSRTLFEEEVEIGGSIFPISAEVGARDRTQFAAAEYRYAFVNNGRAEAGLRAGLGVMDLDVTLFGSIGAGEGLQATASESLGTTIVLPVVGVYTDFTLTRRLLLSVEGLLFSFALSGNEGDVSDSRVALRWYPSKIFGFGVALNRTRIDVDLERGNDTIRLNYVLDGPSVFITFAIPGSRYKR